MKSHMLVERIEGHSDREEPKSLILVKSKPIAEERGLFSDVFVETSGGEKKRRTFSTVLSIAIECAVLAVLIILPLMFTEVLPTRELVTSLMAPPPPPPPAPPAAPVIQAKTIAASNVLEGHLLAPSKIPKEIAIIKETEAPPVGTGVVGGVAGGVPGGQVNGVLGGIVNSTTTPEITAPVTPKIIRISQGVSQGLLVNRVVPEYPSIARAAHVQGDVELRAVIATDGTIQRLELVSGNPLLVPSAIKAVEQWRFKPYLLNGIPVEVETDITVKFVLAG